MNTRKENNNVFFATWCAHKKDTRIQWIEQNNWKMRRKDDLGIWCALYYRFGSNISCGPVQVQSLNGSSHTKVGNIRWSYLRNVFEHGILLTNLIRVFYIYFVDWRVVEGKSALKVWKNLWFDIYMYVCLTA